MLCDVVPLPQREAPAGIYSPTPDAYAYASAGWLYTVCHQHSRKVLTLSGAGLGLVALHVLQTLQESQVVPPDGLHLAPGSLSLLPRLHPSTTIVRVLKRLQVPVNDDDS